jgi:hypothetical protein
VHQCTDHYVRTPSTTYIGDINTVKDERDALRAECERLRGENNGLKGLLGAAALAQRSLQRQLEAAEKVIAWRRGGLHEWYDSGADADLKAYDALKEGGTWTA